MAVYHLKASIGSRGGGQSAAAKNAYICREGRYGRDAGEVEHVEHGNMPEWAADTPRLYWQAADENERANGSLYREVQFALPQELSQRERVDLARQFAQGLTTNGERLPYTLAVHRGDGENPHAHLVMSERVNDGRARTAETWFRRANPQAAERGGARKSRAGMPREWLTNTRKDWERRANEALERVGSGERIDRRSWGARREEALKRGDIEAAARCSRRPNVHMGPRELRHHDGKEQKDQRVRGENEASEAARDKIAEQIAAQQTVIARLEKELQRIDKADRARRALDVAARLVPVSKEERAIGQAVGKAIGKRLAKTGRSGGERGEPSSRTPREREPAARSPQQEPTLWERYQQRWPERPEAERQLVEEISREPDYWREQLEERFQRKLGWQKWDGTPGMEPTEPKPLPRSLAAEGKAEPGAAENEQLYTESLPEHYRQKWEQEGISPRAAEAEQQARTSLRARVSLRPEKHVEAAVRKECGADAQGLDKEMREDMEQHRPRMAVLSRIDTMQSEEWRESGERFMRESLERARTREPKSEQEQERDRGGMSR